MALGRSVVREGRLKLPILKKVCMFGIPYQRNASTYAEFI